MSTTIDRCPGCDCLDLCEECQEQVIPIPEQVSCLRLTAYPELGDPDHWQLTVEATGEVLAWGDMPCDPDVVRLACQRFHKRGQPTRNPKTVQSIEFLGDGNALVRWTDDSERIVPAGDVAGILQAEFPAQHGSV